MDAVPTVSNAGANQVVCTNTMNLAGNIPLVGSGNWIILSGSATLISPTSANSTVVNLQNGTTNFRWRISNGVCPSSFDTVAIKYTPITAAIIGIDSNYCSTSALLSLDSSHINATPAGGNFTFFIDGNLEMSLNAALLTAGTHQLKLSYQEPSTGICFAGDSVIFTVGNSCNKQPVANDDFYTLSEDVALNASSVLANDTDPNPSDILTIQTNPLIPPLHGNLILHANGTFNYVPNLNFSGSDFFTYQICDTSNACDTATVRLEINAVNDAPFAINDTISTNEGQRGKWNYSGK